MSDVPTPIIRDDWIDPEMMSEWVLDALSHGVGLVRAIGDGSFAMTTWIDTDRAGRRHVVSAGEWSTVWLPTPTAVLECLVNSDAPPQEPDMFRERKFRVRYWTERRSGVSRPGRLQLVLTVYVRPPNGEGGHIVEVVGHQKCMARAFLTRLGSGGGSP